VGCCAGIDGGVAGGQAAGHFRQRRERVRHRWLERFLAKQHQQRVAGGAEQVAGLALQRGVLDQQHPRFGLRETRRCQRGGVAARHGIEEGQCVQDPEARLHAQCPFEFQRTGQGAGAGVPQTLAQQSEWQ